jgi:hypothetical protein
MSTKPKDIIVVYLALAIMVGVFYLTLRKNYGNIRDNRKDNKREYKNTGVKLEN